MREEGLVRVKYRDPGFDRRLDYVQGRMRKGLPVKIQSFGIANSTATQLACMVQGLVPGVNLSAKVLEDERTVRDGEKTFGLEIMMTRAGPPLKTQQVNRQKRTYVKKSELDDDKKEVETNSAAAEPALEEKSEVKTQEQ